MGSFRESPLEPCTEVGSSISFNAPTASNLISVRVGNVYYVQLQTRTEWKNRWEFKFLLSSGETLTGTFMTSLYVKLQRCTRARLLRQHARLWIRLRCAQLQLREASVSVCGWCSCSWLWCVRLYLWLSVCGLGSNNSNDSYTLCILSKL